MSQDVTELESKLKAAVDKLAEFETPDELAEFLNSLGVKGECGSPWACPIAVYLQRELGLDTPHALSVGPHDAGLDTPAGGTVIFFPRVVTEFIRSFDNGKTFTFLKAA